MRVIQSKLKKKKPNFFFQTGGRALGAPVLGLDPPLTFNSGEDSSLLR